jgi:hypothetical protein
MPIGKPFGSYAADYNDAKLRLHRGAVDQDTLTSRPPNEVLVAIRNALTMMGIDAKRHSDFKLKCTRPKRNSNQPLSKSERSRKISTSVPFKNLFNKSTPDVHPDFQKPSVTGETIYGEQSIDSGDEVRFTVELAKIENLPGLYVVDIRRVRGSIWAFKYLYHTLLDILDLVGKGGYMAHRPTISENPLNPVEQNRKSYMTTSSSGSSIMLFEEPVAVR